MTTAALSRAVNCLDGGTLRELAVIAETRTPPRPSAWQRLPVEAVDEALTMDSEKLSMLVGVNPDDFDRHTALSDARWAKAIYEAVLGRPGELAEALGRDSQ